jgi:cytochrome c-type biogenesis protein CcsB
MKKIKNLLFSMPTTLFLLVIFGISIGYATFAESSSGTEYAKQIVYNAKWFEGLMILLIINMIGSIFRYDLINRKKWSVLLFHVAFILILIGAAVTRYVGFEGMMHIRQGETSNEISSDKNSVGIVAEFDGQKVEKTKEITFSESGSNNFSEALSIGGKTITIENEMFVPNSVETIVPDEKGEPALSLFVMDQQNQGSDFILMNNELNQFAGLTFSFGDSIQKSNVNFILKNNTLYFRSNLPVAKMEMMQKVQSDLMPETLYPAEEKTIYKADNVIFVIKSFMAKATKNLTQFNAESNKSGIKNQGKDAVIFKVSDGNVSKKINVFTSDNQASVPATCLLNNVKVSISYGMLQRKLPFSIHLKAFKLDRYAGSDSPSSYASEISVIDNEKKIEKPFLIYMNNILNYRGYRFYQSSYDTDEMGTVLSVNHDYWGTLITYLGYFFMMLGMVWTLFNKNSRFRTVLKLSNELQQKRKSGKLLVLGLLIFGAGFVSAQENSKANHLNALNSLLVQNATQGRIEPLNTYASDILRKIYKKTTYNTISPVEVVLGMSANPSFWENEPIIKVSNVKLAKELGAIGTYVSFNQLFDFSNGGVYRLKNQIEEANQKPQSAHNEYDKEVINVDERVNICYELFNGDMLAIFPVVGSENGKWTTGKNTQAGNEMMNGEMSGGMTGTSVPENTKGQVCPATGMSGKTTDAQGNVCPVTGMTGKTTKPIDAQLSIENTPSSLFKNYLKAVNESYQSGNWDQATISLNKIKSFQIQHGGTNLPGKTQIQAEIFYNKINIFLNLAIYYILTGLILLILYLIDVFRARSGMDKIMKFAIYPFILLFAIYTAGLILRWYISGHAPWSNGYESMIFVGWGASLAGLIFARKSPVTLAVTGILSSIALFTAAMSWMNPEITNLVPVLKSYWLIIHVAVITSSYGFLAMAALLGFLNLILMVARNEKNKNRLKFSILEISYIIEISMIIGLFMLTVGCFIGGIWANESWGRYWGWDPKETWSLVSIVIYAAILHMRNVPKLNNQFFLSSLSLAGFGTIIMTFLGVNYYLSGMHSYGQGTPPEIPAIVYVVLLAIIALIAVAYNSEKKYQIKKNK